MAQAIRQKVVVQPGGSVTVQSSALPVGSEAEVIVIVHSQDSGGSYRALFGSGKGGFASPEEADAFLRKERDAWED